MAWVTEKRSIVLLHGVVSSQLTWWRLKPDLLDLGWQVSAVDMLGHGSRHAAGRGELTVDDLAQDVLAQIPGPVHVLAGHSCGCAPKQEDNFGFSFWGDGMLDYDRRAGGFTYWATWAPKRLGDPSKLPASYYVKGFRDASGDLFKGDHLYRLRVPADTPARDFWSIVAYEIGTNAFIHNEQNEVGLSSHDIDQLVVNDDGSIDLYIGPNPPQGFEQNWIPTAGRDFWLLFRFYGPQKPLFDRTWTSDDVLRVQ